MADHSQRPGLVGAARGNGRQLAGILALVDNSKKDGANNAAANGGVLSFADLDLLLDLVTDKDGAVDYIMMHSRTVRAFSRAASMELHTGLARS